MRRALKCSFSSLFVSNFFISLLLIIFLTLFSSLIFSLNNFYLIKC